MLSCGEVEVKAAKNGPLLTPLALLMKSATLLGSETYQYLKNLTAKVKTHVPQ